MRTRYIPAGVMLIAGAVTCIVSIVQNQDIVKSLITLLVVLILFYVIGLVAKFFIENASNDSEENLEDGSVDGENSPNINDKNRL